MSERKRKHNDKESGFTFYCDLYKMKRKCQEENDENDKNMSERKRKHNDEESGFTFYCDLYKMKRKCQEENDEDILQEAANSWLTLSDLEKRKVFAKFKQYKLKSMELFAKKLKNVQPYMKKKVKNRNHESTTWTNDNVVNSLNNSKSESESMNIEDNSMGSFSSNQDVNENNQNNSNHVELHKVVNESRLDETEYNMCSEVNEEVNIHFNRVTESPINNEVITELRCEDQNKEMLILKPREPPPPVRCAKELYTMLKGDLAVPYSSLLPSEKKIYVNALRTLKKQYIFNYMAFLQSLSSEELLNYYHNQTFL